MREIVKGTSQKRWCVALGGLLLALTAAAPPAARAAKASADPRGKVVVLAIEGAGAEELARRQAAGDLPERGFARLAELGQHASKVKVRGAQSPSAALVTLVTGASPAEHDVLSERVHLPSQLLRDWTSADVLPLGAATLWQSARASSRQVGVIRWTGADNRSTNRRGSWGVLPDGEPQFTQRALNLVRADFRDEHYGSGPGPAARWSMPPGVPSYSTPLTFSLEYSGGESLYQMIFDLIAVDRSDDGVVNYDGFVVSQNVDPSVGYLGTIDVGGWFRLDMPLEVASAVSGTRPSAWMHLIEVAPDLSRIRLYVGGAYGPYVYPGSIRRQLEIRDLVPPGPTDATALVRDSGFAPRATVATIAGQLLRSAEFTAGSVLAGTKLPWDLILARATPFEEAAEVRTNGRDDAAAIRLAAWQAADHAVAMLLDELDLSRQTLIVVSSQGFQEVQHELDLSEVMRQSPALQALLQKHQQYGLVPVYRVVANGGSAYVYLNEKGRSSDGFLSRQEVDEAAEGIARALTDDRSLMGRDLEKVVRGKELERFGIGGPAAPALVVLARPGVRLIDRARGSILRYDPPSRWFTGGYGGDATRSGIYFEVGAGAKPGKSIGSIALEEVAARVAKRVGIAEPRTLPSAP